MGINIRKSIAPGTVPAHNERLDVYKRQDRYFNPEIETASREYLWALQSARLIKMVHNAYDHVPFYQKKFDEIGLLPGDIKTIDDITKLPFTVKQDLRDNYPFGLFAVPKDQMCIRDRCWRTPCGQNR